MGYKDTLAVAARRKAKESGKVWTRADEIALQHRVDQMRPNAGPQTYLVKAGDNPFSIAEDVFGDQRYGYLILGMNDIQKDANGKFIIRPGDRLTLPTNVLPGFELSTGMVNYYNGGGASTTGVTATPAPGAGAPSAPGVKPATIDGGAPGQGGAGGPTAPGNNPMAIAVNKGWQATAARYAGMAAAHTPQVTQANIIGGGADQPYIQSLMQPNPILQSIQFQLPVAKPRVAGAPATKPTTAQAAPGTIVPTPLTTLEGLLGHQIGLPKPQSRPGTGAQTTQAGAPGQSAQAISNWLNSPEGQRSLLAQSARYTAAAFQEADAQGDPLLRPNIMSNEVAMIMASAFGYDSVQEFTARTGYSWDEVNGEWRRNDPSGYPNSGGGGGGTSGAHGGSSRGRGGRNGGGTYYAGGSPSDGFSNDSADLVLWNGSFGNA